MAIYILRCVSEIRRSGIAKQDAARLDVQFAGIRSLGLQGKLSRVRVYYRYSIVEIIILTVCLQDSQPVTCQSVLR